MWSKAKGVLRWRILCKMSSRVSTIQLIAPAFRISHGVYIQLSIAAGMKKRRARSPLRPCIWLISAGVRIGIHGAYGKKMQSNEGARDLCTENSYEVHLMIVLLHDYMLNRTSNRLHNQFDMLPENSPSTSTRRLHLPSL